MFRTMFVLMIGSSGAGQAAGFATDKVKAAGATKRIFAIIDAVSKIDPTSTSGEKPVDVAGKIEFKDIAFAYPTRT